MLRAPQSRMDVLTQGEIKDILSRSHLIRKYNEKVDRDSAYEILQEKIERANEEEKQAELKAQREKAARVSRRSRGAQKTVLEQILSSSASRQVGRTVARELTRGLLSVLGVKKR